MGFTGIDDVINQTSNYGKADERTLYKRTNTAQGDAVWHRTWGLAGMPGAGSEPASTPGVAYSNTAGGINFANVASPATKHIMVWGAFTSEFTTTVANWVGNVTFALQDRLVGVGGILVTSTGAKTVNSVSLPRYTDGYGLDVWVEVTGAITGTPQIHLSNYTNTSGTPNRVGAITTLPTNAVAGSIYKLQLQDGDVGLLSIQDITVDVAGSAGTINVVITKQLGAPIQGAPFTYTPRANIRQLEVLPRIYDGATLEVRYLAAGTTFFDMYGQVFMAYGS